jgi:uncharacterized protein YbcV (DUF1398 family)
MEIEDKIQAAYKSAKNYPELVKMLISAGIQSYTVEVSTGIILYRLAAGESHLHQKSTEPKQIEKNFSEALTVKAIRDNQQGKSDYPTFMNDIAKAGVRFYEATLSGSRKRVVYIGIGGYYEELIPLKD